MHSVLEKNTFLGTFNRHSTHQSYLLVNTGNCICSNSLLLTWNSLIQILPLRSCGVSASAQGQYPEKESPLKGSCERLEC